jgi:hypothetical protein
MGPRVIEMSKARQELKAQMLKGIEEVRALTSCSYLPGAGAPQVRCSATLTHVLQVNKEGQGSDGECAALGARNCGCAESVDWHLQLQACRQGSCMCCTGPKVPKGRARQASCSV